MSIDIMAEAEALLPKVTELRRRIHANPELGNQLPETTQAALDSLAGLDLEYRYSKDTTGFVATLHGAGNGPRIMLRADMDALPMPEDNDLPFASKNAGRMHACGHDSHTAMLSGAAHLLSAHRDAINGSIDFFFQTGEEGHFGARVAIDEGLFEAPNAPDAVFAIHITPQIPVGTVNCKPGPLLAAADTWELEIVGKGGHASMPHDCLDPIPVACDIVSAYNTFVTRRINAFDPVVLTTTKIEAGTTSNVIPESARLMGTLRSTSPRARALAHEGLERIAHSIAAAHEMEARFSLNEGYPVTINDPDFAEFARKVAIKLLGEQGFIPMRAPMMGAEDFSYFLQRWPGVMMFLGVKPDDPTLAAPCHSNRMMLNEAGMAHGVALHAQIALDWLSGQTA
ncbi:MAG TPA: M20 family metallopeptidase [Pseudomonadales bacterium]|nr:M20 family metallopeptidase [Pseudomonadales bacterium]